MARRDQLSDEDIARLANAEISAAVTYDGTDFQKNRVRAMQYYRGEMTDLDNEDGLSQAVTHDVQDVIGWILPGLMRVYFSSDELGEYQPEDEEDEEQALQATAYVNYLVMKECNGYQVFWDVFHDALLHANGIVKHWWEEETKTSVHLLSGLDDDQFAELVNSPEIEVMAHTEETIVIEPELPDEDDLPPAPPMPSPNTPVGGMPPPAAPPVPPSAPPGGVLGMMGGGQPPMPPPPGPPMGGMGMLGGMGMPPMPPQPVEMTLHSVKVKRTKKGGKLRIAAVPPEEFLINLQARDIPTARFVGHRMTRIRSDLIAAGYDEDKVNELPASSFSNYGNLPQTRIDSALPFTTQPGLDKSMEEVELVEVYMRMDADGDGIAEMMKITMAGPTSTVLLDAEPWEDEVPFSDFVAERVPHRWQGRSTFDDTEDIQQIKSTLLRQFLDNLYHANIPDRVINIERIVNPDALLDRKIGNNIHTEGPPDQAIQDMTVPFAAKEALTGLEYMDKLVERRTGVSQATMALDLEALQNQSATAVNAAQSASYSKIELIARNFAMLGFQRFFQCLLKLLVAHQEEARRIKVKRQWVTMDPAYWNAGMRFNVNVGLGSGSRDRDAQILMQLAAKQEQINMQLGPDNPLCGLDKYSNTLRSLVRMALPSADPDLYFNEVDQKEIAAWQAQKAQNQPPNPDMVKAQAKTQEAQANIQIKQQTAQADMALRAQKTQADLAADAQKTQADMAANREKNVLDMQAAREKNAFQMQADREKAAQEAEQREQEALLDAQLRQDEMLMEAQLTEKANAMQADNADRHSRRMADVNLQRQRTQNKTPKK